MTSDANSVGGSSSSSTASGNSVDQIGDLKLFLGDKNGASNLELLSRLKVTHILTAELIPLPHLTTSHLPHLAVLHVPIADLCDSDLLSCLDASIRFMRQGLESGGGVLVHCYHGVSRSAAVVTAYLMRTRGISLEEALAWVRMHRPAATPNDGFLQQLKLFQSMGYRVDEKNKAFMYYRLKCLQNQVLHTKILPPEVHRYRDQDVPFRRNRAAATGENSLPKMRTLYRCKKCRQILATQSGVIPHKPGQVGTWQDLIGVKEDESKSCRVGLFVEPLRWMSMVFATVTDRIHCSKCKGKLGNFSWNGSVKCGCGGTLSPGFLLNMSRVDRCTMLKELEMDL